LPEESDRFEKSHIVLK